MTDTPPPAFLPATIDYHHVITTLEQLLPGLDPSKVMSVRISTDLVTVEWWEARRHTHCIRIVHRQGSATEGGDPTPPPTGVDQLIEGDTQ